MANKIKVTKKDGSYEILDKNRGMAYLRDVALSHIVVEAMFANIPLVMPNGDKVTIIQEEMPE